MKDHSCRVKKPIEGLVLTYRYNVIEARERHLAVYTAPKDRLARPFSNKRCSML